MVRPVRPKPAASLVITKQKKNDLYVLMGQRPKNSRFAPNVWVFPGGRVEKSDILNKSIKLSKKNLDDLSKLKATKTLSVGLISAAIRETEEETNLKLIDKNLKNLWVLARAITPANQKIRFDTKFFVLDEKNFLFHAGTEIKNENIESKCKWSPFNGFKFKGTPTHTIIAGKIKMQDGKILGDPDGTPLQFS